LQQFKSEFENRNAGIAVITFETGHMARGYAEETRLDWLILVDQTRELYSAYGMLTATFWEIWGPSTWWAYMKAVARGYLPKHSEGDVSQRGGDVLIDPAGVVRMHHIGRTPADRPSVDAILARMG
jgi:hypothetical protein